MAFYELRQYFVRPGKMDEWVKIMEESGDPDTAGSEMLMTSAVAIFLSRPSGDTSYSDRSLLDGQGCSSLVVLIRPSDFGDIHSG